MRIVGFQSENFKKLRVVDITPDANAVLLTGGNEQGKTSLLDGIESVLEGEKVLKRTPKPIRDGEERAFNIVALGEPSYDEHGNEVECRPTLKATRTFTAKGSYLKVENIEGAQYKSPQAILDKLVGDLTFDPLAFSNLKDKEQLETLLKLVQIPLDLDEWAAERKAVYEGRTALNRVVSDLEGQVKAFVVEPDTPDEEISAASVLAEMRDAQDVINENRTIRDAVRAAGEAVKQWQQSISIATEEVSRCERALGVAKQTLLAKETGLKHSEMALESCEEDAAGLLDPDLSTFQQRIAEVEDLNQRVRANKARTDLSGKLNRQKQESAAASKRLEALDHQRAEALASAQMPIPDLSFNDDGVTYKTIPFRQCSSEERLRVSVAMGMSLNPKLRVMFVRDASLLDTKHRDIILQMAADNQYQLWLEIADDTGKVGLYFEDGAIVSQAGVRKLPKRQPAKVKEQTASLEF